ncbi:helix-turn-helix transcriptional regulator [Oscillospiraceae bacterium Marseille-Q3528]|nr:helix-turn-helix transcriptional regulator [Oscillospiraceae bacterium Marseille-Q3528]
MGRNERMRQARQNAGLSQEELARRIGASRQTVNMIERGDYNPSLHLCISICQTLGKTLDELFWPEHETSQEK